MTQPQDKMRAEFEDHAKRNGLCIDRAPCQRGVSEKYWSTQTQHTWEGWTAACAQQSAQSTIDIDALANEIRRVDGNHSLGAGALAEALVPFLSAQSQQDALDAARFRQTIRHVGGQRHTYCQTFGLVTLKPVSGNIMQGSVSEHFVKAIDAAIAAQGASNV